MYWSNYGPEDYEEMLRGIGFRVLETMGIGHGYAEARRMPDERHPLVLVWKD